MRQRQFTLQDQLAFAQLSGDYNPLHVDPIAARRYMFGRPVVHGVHALLWALDTWAGEHNLSLNLRSVRVTFAKPIGLGEPVDCFILSNLSNHLEVEVRAGKVVSTKIVVDWEKTTRDLNSQRGSHSTIEGFPPKHSPRMLSLDELGGISGSLELYLQPAEIARLFPHLSESVAPFQIATLLSTTRLVGVECPGLHSLFSSLDLSFPDGEQRRPAVNYAVSKVDHRFGLVYLKLDGEFLRGTIKAFLRPSPVEQPSYSSLRACVGAGEFAGQTALIIGGSRGLGEVVAKLLTAGGATVRITYHRGEQDARRLVEQITSEGGHADLAELDVLNSYNASSIDSTASWAPTHCYCFATPFISPGTGGSFSAALFSSFCAYYVKGFADTVDHWHGIGVTNFFYPSTAYIDEIPANLAEYTAAKAAGEKLCEFLEKTHPMLVIYKPRLPRMNTDQTVSVVPVENRDPAAVMLYHLRAFRTISEGT